MAGNNISNEISKIETKKTIQRLLKQRVEFFVKISKMNKLLPKLTKRWREAIQTNKTRIKNGDITDTKEIQRLLGHNFKACTPQSWDM
jgi:putative cell wall-binding protein